MYLFITDCKPQVADPCYGVKSTKAIYYSNFESRNLFFSILIFLLFEIRTQMVTQ